MAELATLALRLDATAFERSAKSAASALDEIDASAKRVEKTVKDSERSAAGAGAAVQQRMQAQVQAARSQERVIKQLMDAQRAQSVRDAQRQAREVVAAMEQQYQRDMARVREAQARGMLTQAQAREAGRLNAIAYNEAMLRTIDKGQAAGAFRGPMGGASHTVLAGSLKTVGDEATKSAISVGRLREGVTTLAANALNAAPGITQLSGVLGSMALGSAITVGVLAAAAAIGLAWDKLTSKARALKEETAEAVERLRDVAKEQRQGAFGDLGDDILKAQFRMTDIVNKIRDLKRSDYTDARTGLRVSPNAREIQQLRTEYDEIHRLTQAGERRRQEIVQEERDKAATEAKRKADERARIEKEAADKIARQEKELSDYIIWLADRTHREWIAKMGDGFNGRMMPINTGGPIPMPTGLLGVPHMPGTVTAPPAPNEKWFSSILKDVKNQLDPKQLLTGIASNGISGGLSLVMGHVGKLFDGLMNLGRAAELANERIREINDTLAGLQARATGDDTTLRILDLERERRAMLKQFPEIEFSGGNGADTDWDRRFGKPARELINRTFDELIAQAKRAKEEVERNRAAAIAFGIEDSRIRELRAQGDSDQAERQELYLRHAREVWELVERGASDAEHAALALAQTAERARHEAELIEKHTRRSEDLGTRRLRAMGLDRAADDAAMAAEQRRELRDARQGGWTEAEIRELQAVQALERNQVAANRYLEDQTKAIEEHLQKATEFYDKQIATAQQTLSTVQDQLRTAEQSASETRRVLDTLRSFAGGLVLNGGLTTLSPTQQLTEARKQYDTLVGRAMQGDRDAAGGIPDAARAYLEASRAVNASGAAYVADFNRVRATVGAITDQFGAQLTTEEKMLAEMQKQTARLEQQIAALQTSKDAAAADADRQIMELKKANALLLQGQLGAPNATNLNQIAHWSGITVGNLMNMGGLNGAYAKFLASIPEGTGSWTWREGQTSYWERQWRDWDDGFAPGFYDPQNMPGRSSGRFLTRDAKTATPFTQAELDEFERRAQERLNAQNQLLADGFDLVAEEIINLRSVMGDIAHRLEGASL